MSFLIESIIQSITPFISDPASLLSLFGVSATMFFSGRTVKYYNLKKNQKTNNKKIVFLPQIIKEQINTFDDKQVTDAFRNDVNDFYNILKENFSEDLLVNFNNNINDASIYKNVFDLLEHGAFGCHSASNNIFIIPLAKKSVLTHELLHLSSFIKSPNNNYNWGFYQFGKGQNGEEIDFGRGINEGYTELLNRRFFYPNSKASHTYEYMVSITDAMEKIVGQDLMTECYFKADFVSVYNEMLKYIDMYKTQDFLSKTEYLFKLFSKDSGNTMLDYKNIKQQFLDVNNTLIEAFINKQKLNNSFNEKDISNFIEHLPSSFSKAENKYSFKIDPNIYLQKHYEDDVKDSSISL